MKQEINPKDSNRETAFNLWLKSPMPMVTLTKTINVTKIYKICKSKNLKFNMLLCYCIGKAASQIDEFYTLPEQGRLYRYDQLSVNVIVSNVEGGINSCDVLYSSDLKKFNDDYMSSTQSTRNTCTSSFLEGSMVVGTSAMIDTELDCIVNQYTDKFCNPMVMWGKYRKGLFKVTLPISFQFHHVQMDGGHAARFLEKLQKEIDNLKK